jgi:ribonuclease T
MLKDRFRKYLPVVVDLETGGFDPLKNAILEIAITLIEEEDEQLVVGQTHRDHPLRRAVEEEVALKELFKIINQTKNKYECSRAILVGHNAHFDSSFLNASIERNGIKRSPFHPFSVLDTVTLGALATKQTVLARICELLDIDYDSKEAHSAAYDSDVTAKVFCKIINKYS